MKKIALLVVIALAPLSLLAQDTGLGTPSFGSFSGGGFDTVNNQNLNVNFSVPLVSSAGRGMPLSLALTYNSLVWQPVGSWTPAVDSNGNPTWGWTKDFPAGGAVYFASTTVRIKCFDPGYPLFSYTTRYTDYGYVDVLSTVHSFPLVVFSLNPNCPSQNFGTYTGYAADASGYYINVNALYPASSPTNTVTDPTGKIVVNGSGNASDANGNYITKTVISSTETDWTDSVGNTALKIIYSPSQTAPTTIQYKFLDGTGASNYQTITLKLQPYSIKTVFGCSIGEYSGTANLPYELDIPSPNGGGTNLTYKFTYEGTPNNSGYYTGRLLKVALPAGGSYEYDYPQTASPYGINCADGTTVNVNRKVSDGTNTATWNYVRNVSAGTTTMTTPALPDTPSANDAVYTFNSGGEETSRKVYGNSPGTTLLRTVNTTWAGNGTPSTQIVILEDSNHTQSETATTFDSNGLLDSMTEYDWGQGAPGNPIRQTNYTYQTSTNYTSRNIINLITSKQITNGQQSTVLYRQDILYDGVMLATCPASALQHYDSAYPCSMNYRGNPTQVTTYLSPNTPSNPVSKNFTYDWFGNQRTAQINCCQTKTYSYSSATQYSEPDSITSGSSPQLITSFTYNSYTGVQLTATDPNNLVRNSSYDFLRRPMSVWLKIGSTSGASVSYSYDDVHFTSTTTSTIDSSKSIQQVAAMDGLGRTTKSTLEDANSNIYSIVSTQYDIPGRLYKSSNPYTGSPSFWVTTQFDVLGRPISSTLPDNSATTYSYATNTVIITDPAGKQRETETDGVVRLSVTLEPDPANGNTLTLQTTSSYNVLDQLTQTVQGSQTRSYNYDALGRVLSISLPESGLTCFGSVTGSTCNSNGYDQWNNLLMKTDARGVLTSFSYDTLNRLIGVAYTIPNGSGVSSMPYVCDPLGGTNISANVCFAYGTSASSYNNGRPITMTDGVGSENYTFNNFGQMTQLQKKISGTTYTMGYQYNIAGQPTQVIYPSSRVVQKSMDPIGRLCEVAPSTTGCNTASNPYTTGFSYNSAQEPSGFKYGNGLYASLGYSSDRLQLNCIDYSTTNRNGACAHDSTTKFGLNYSYGPTGSNNGQISGTTDSFDNGRSATYTYDSLGRLTQASTTGSTNYPNWDLKFAYDRYGNRTNQTVQSDTSPNLQPPAPSNSVTVNPSNNQISTVGYAYDLSGNMTNDGYNTLVYDGASRVTSATNVGGSGTYSYDGKGLRVTKVATGTTTVYIFSGGKVIAEYQNGAAPSSPTREYVYSGSILTAKIEGGSTNYYHTDHLSTRLLTDGSGNVLGQQGHYPFGETWYAQNTTTKWEYTSYERDSESGNDFAMAREGVNRLGRFSSTDPVAGSNSDPQSLDRYSYVENDPINLVDPSGQLIYNPPPAPPPPPPLLPPGAFDDPDDDTFYSGSASNGDLCIKISRRMFGFSLSQAQQYCAVPIFTPAQNLAEKVLSGNNDCANFFNKSVFLSPGDITEGGPTYANAAEVLASDTLKEVGDLSPLTGATSVQSAGFGATININGASNGVFLSNRGSIGEFGGLFSTGSLVGQTIQVMHELGHTLGVIPPDVYPNGTAIPNASSNNSTTIVINCALAILAAINGSN